MVGTGFCISGSTSGTGLIVQRSTPGDCSRIGGTFEPDPTGSGSGSGSGSGFCAVRTILARALGDNILFLGSSFYLTYLFRDNILNKSKVGKRFLKHYYAHAHDLYAIVVGDPELLGTCIIAWTKFRPIIQCMVDLVGNSKTPYSKNANSLRLTREKYNLGLSLIKRFRAATANKRLQAVLDEVKLEFRKYEGLSSSEALRKLLDKKAPK